MNDESKVPASPVYEVCPFCHREVRGHAWEYNGHRAESWTCAEHGPVVPMKSAVRRRDD